MITKKINGGNFEPVVTGEIVLDAVPTEGSLNAVTSDGVAQAIAEGGGGSYTAGDGIAISEGEISAKVDGTTIQVNASGELEAIGGGGGSYTSGNGISIDGSEISAVLGMSSGGMHFDNDGIAVDWEYVESSSDGTLEAVSDGYGDPSGIKVVNPVPDTTGASSGDVLTIGQNGPEWAAPAGGGGGSYTAIFGSSTYADVLAAFQAGKVIYAAFSDGSVTAPLVEFEPNGQDPVDCKFTFNSVKIDQAGRQSVFVYTLYLDSTNRWDVVNKTL